MGEELAGAVARGQLGEQVFGETGDGDGPRRQRFGGFEGGLVAPLRIAREHRGQDGREFFGDIRAEKMDRRGLGPMSVE